ncbi:hypothetical protein JW916_16850 [Candidatus Sumerlaeota bacterium]|nr:hypothetical protein [Candidatus Sumerlaeota bacterium]
MRLAFPYRLIASLVVSVSVSTANPAVAQHVFPELIPPDAFLVVSVPRADGAWRAFESMRIVKAAETLLHQQTAGADLAAGALDQEIASRLGFTLDGQTLFGGILSATELALLPRRSGRPEIGFLWLGRVRDAVRLRQVLDVFEAEIVRRSASESNPVTRATESIGDCRVVILTDPTTSIGYFLNGPQAVWAFSNDPKALRNAARALESAPEATERPSSSSAEDTADRAHLQPALEVMKGLRDSGGGDDFHVRFYIAPPRIDDWRMREGQSGFEPDGMGVSGIDPLLNRFRSQGATGGGLRFGPEAIEVQSLTLFAPNESSLSADLYRSTPAMKELPDLRYMAADALILGGNNLLDMPRLRGYLLVAVDGWASALPPVHRPGLNDASAQARERLESLRTTLSDPDLLSELGPEWFFALNDFEFLGPGKFPRVDFLIGFRTRDAARTRDRMTRIEDGLTQAASDWARERLTTAPLSAPTQTVLPTSTPSTSPTMSVSTSTLTSVASASSITLGFDQTYFTPAPDALPVAIRFFRSSRLPEHLRPAWCIANGTLLIGLSPDMVSEAVRRSTSASPLEDDLRSLRAEAGMDSVHAYQIVRFSRATGVLLAILQPIVSKVQPGAMPQLGAMAQALEPIETIAFFRQGSATGIRTAGIVRMRESKTRK